MYTSHSGSRIVCLVSYSPGIRLANLMDAVSIDYEHNYRRLFSNLLWYQTLDLV